MGKWLIHKDLDDLWALDFVAVKCSPTLGWHGLHAWLRQYTEDDFYIPTGDKICFKSEKDAILFKLKYGQG